MSDNVFSLKFTDIKWIVITSYLISIIIDNTLILSLKMDGVPYFTVLTLMFWVTQILNKTHLMTAFLLGLMFDASLNTPLGSHSLIFISLTFLMLRSRLRFKGYPLWQQSLIIGSYFMVFQVVSWFLFHPVLEGDALYTFWLEPLWAALIWPVFMTLLQRITYKLAFR